MNHNLVEWSSFSGDRFLQGHCLSFMFSLRTSAPRTIIAIATMASITSTYVIPVGGVRVENWPVWSEIAAGKYRIDPIIPNIGERPLCRSVKTREITFRPKPRRSKARVVTPSVVTSEMGRVSKPPRGVNRGSAIM